MSLEDKQLHQNSPLPFKANANVPVFSLELLMTTRSEPTSHQVRLANLDLPPVVKPTPRDAIAAIVDSAKKLIRESIASGQPVPWLDPKQSPEVGETRMIVPIHL